MFKKLKDLNVAFHHIRSFSIAFILVCTLLCGFVIYQANQLSRDSQQRIYILANGKALEALAADRKDNIEVEARDHVKIFHQLFFSLSPDEKVIQGNIKKALYLADGTAKQNYDNLKETGYYTNIISGNISQDIREDSIHINLSAYPYYFRYKGIIRITRPSSIVSRSLITEGFLRNLERSDNNPHGFLIEKWQTIDNRDLTVEERTK